MIDRILITGRNRDLPHRPFTNIHFLPEPQPCRRITRVWTAGDEQQIPSAEFLSATKPNPGAVPGSSGRGALHLVQTHKHCRRAPSRPHPYRLGVHLRVAADIGMMLIAGCLTVAMMTLVLI